MNQECWNKYKIDLYCKLGDYADTYFEKRKYSIKDCSNAEYKLKLAAAMLAVLCPLCLDSDDENYCLTEDELCKAYTYIKELIKNCNC